MAGLFAVRALRAGRERFDPFGERSDNEDEEEDNLDDVEEPEDDGRVVTAPAMKTKAKWEVNAAEVADAAFDLTDGEPAPSAAGAAAKPSLPPLTTLGTVWETPCELLYEDDDAEVFSVRFSPELRRVRTMSLCAWDAWGRWHDPSMQYRIQQVQTNPAWTHPKPRRGREFKRGGRRGRGGKRR